MMITTIYIGLAVAFVILVATIVVNVRQGRV